MKLPTVVPEKQNKYNGHPQPFPVLLKDPGMEGQKGHENMADITQTHMYNHIDTE